MYTNSVLGTNFKIFIAFFTCQKNPNKISEKLECSEKLIQCFKTDCKNTPLNNTLYEIKTTDRSSKILICRRVYRPIYK